METYFALANIVCDFVDSKDDFNGIVLSHILDFAYLYATKKKISKFEDNVNDTAVEAGFCIVNAFHTKTKLHEELLERYKEVYTFVMKQTDRCWDQLKINILK